MTQALHAPMNNKKKERKKDREQRLLAIWKL
jgi:hypothetical protein